MIRKHLRILVLSIVCASFIFHHCSQKAQDPELAQFDGGVVLQSEYVTHFLKSTQYKPKETPTEENLRKIVIQKAMEKIAIFEAKEQAIDADSLFKAAYSKNKTRLLFYKYMREKFINSVITDSLIHKFYAEFTPQYNMSYIMRPVLRSATPEFDKSQKDSIEYAYNLLESGQKFEDVAKRYSQDITTKKKGGDLGYVIRESMGDAQIRAAMDTLKDFNYSTPIRGYEGYYILYKGQKREVEVPPFEKAKDQIWKSLYHSRKHDIQMALEAQFESLKPVYNYNINEALIKNIEKKAGGNSKTTDLSHLNFGTLSEQDMAKDVVTFKNGSIKVADLFVNPKKAPDTMQDFRKQLSLLAQEQILALHAMDTGMDKLPEIAAELEHLSTSLMQTYLYNRVVKEQAQQKVDSLKSELGIFSDKDQTLRTKRFEIERKLKEDFENKMKDKYHFTFLENHFKNAMDNALIQKKEQQTS